MSKREITVGSTDQTVDIFINDSSSTTGQGLAGLVFNTAGLACYYRKGATGSATQLTLATQTVGGAHSDGGFVEIQATNMKGAYRLDLSDTMVAAAGMLTVFLYGATNMAPCVFEIEVVAVNKFDTIRFGLTALPSVVQGSAGALPTGNASGQVTVATNNDKTGYSLTQAFPTNFSSLAVNASGHVILQDASLVTAKLGTFALAKTTNITGFNDLSAAQVNAEADTALIDIHLDHLFSLADPTGVVANNSFWAKLVAKGSPAVFTTFNNQTDSLEAIRDTVPGLVWDELKVNHVGVGSFGKELGLFDVQTLQNSVQSIESTVLTGVPVTTIAAGAITSVVIADNALTNEKFADTYFQAFADRNANVSTSPTTGSVITSVASQPITVLGTGAIDNNAITAAAANKIADHVRRRTQANVEASANGDALSLGSEYGFIQQAQESSIVGTTLTVKQTDGTTTLGTKTVAVDAAADPITGIS